MSDTSDEKIVEQAIDDALQKAIASLDAEHGLAGLIPDVSDDDQAAVEAQVLGLFARYLEKQGLSPQEEGQAFEVDAAFVRDHGNALMAFMMQGLARQIAGDDEPAPRPSNAPPPIKLDLSESLTELFGAPPDDDDGDDSLF